MNGRSIVMIEDCCNGFGCDLDCSAHLIDIKIERIEHILEIIQTNGVFLAEDIDFLFSLIEELKTEKR